jgi:hypothetical protein
MSSQPNRPNLDDYVPVHERIAAFYEKFPDGSLQSEVVVHTDSMIAMVARAYRTPDDIRPGIGHSSIEVPGRTPYTRGSEMENCETSAWGRAIAALGFEIKRGIATAEEVQNKAGEAPRAAQEPRKAADPTPRPARSAGPTGGSTSGGVQTSSRPTPVNAATSAATTPDGSLSDEDWAGLIPGEAKPEPLGLTNGNGHTEGLSARDLFARLEKAGVDKTVAGDAARKLFGKWKLTDLTDEQRAAVGEEVGVA